MVPSTKVIAERLGPLLEHEYGKDSIDSLSAEIRKTMQDSHSHKEIDEALEYFNKMFCGYGIEAVFGKYVDGYYLTVNLLYVNLGDTYIPTICYDTKEERFHICSWGDFVESKPKRFS